MSKAKRFCEALRPAGRRLLSGWRGRRAPLQGRAQGKEEHDGTQPQVLQKGGAAQHRINTLRVNSYQFPASD